MPTSTRFILRPSAAGGAGGVSATPPPNGSASASNTTNNNTTARRGVGVGPLHGGGGASTAGGARSARAAFDTFLAQRSSAINTQLQELRQRDAALDVQHRQAAASSRTARGPSTLASLAQFEDFGEEEATSQQQRRQTPLHKPQMDAESPQQDRRQSRVGVAPTGDTAGGSIATIDTQQDRRRTSDVARPLAPQHSAPTTATGAQLRPLPEGHPSSSSASSNCCLVELCASVWGPLGLTGDNEGYTAHLLEAWLARASSGARSANDTTVVTQEGEAQEDGESDERRVYRAMWHLLHRTVFYCVHVLTPKTERGDDDSPSTIPVSLKAAVNRSNAGASRGRQPTSASPPSGKKNRQAGGGAANDFDDTPATDLGAILSPRAWVFIFHCLAEMGYPRDAVYVQLPSFGNVQELLLAVLWLTRRYALGAVSILVQLRCAAPFLFAQVHEEETGSRADGDSSASTAVLGYLHGDAWAPATHRDAHVLVEFLRSRKEQIGAIVSDVKERLDRCIEVRRQGASTSATTGGTGGSITRRHRWALHDDDDETTGGDAVGDGNSDHRPLSSSDRAQTLAAQSIMQLRRLVDVQMNRVESMLLRRVALMDAVGASHSTEDLALCMPDCVEEFEAVHRALLLWSSVPSRSKRIAHALNETMDLLMSFARRDAASGGSGGGGVASFAQEFGLMRDVLREDAIYEARLAEGGSAAATGSGAASHPSPDGRHPRCDTPGPQPRRPKGTSALQLQDDDAEDGRDTKHTNGWPLPDDEDDSSTSAPIASLEHVLQRYQRTDAWSFYDGKTRWVRAQYQLPPLTSSPSSKLRRTTSGVAEGLHAIHADEAHRHRRAAAVRDAVSASIDQRYSLRACMAAEMVSYAAVKETRPQPLGDEEADGDGDRMLLAPSENHDVVRECRGLQLDVGVLHPLTKRHTPSTTLSQQTVFVGPPAPGRTTSACVELDRMRLLLADICSIDERVEDAAGRTPPSSAQPSTAVHGADGHRRVVRRVTGRGDTTAGSVA